MFRMAKSSRVTRNEVEGAVPYRTVHTGMRCSDKRVRTNEEVSLARKPNQYVATLNQFFHTDFDLLSHSES